LIRFSVTEYAELLKRAAQVSKQFVLTTEFQYRHLTSPRSRMSPPQGETMNPLQLTDVQSANLHLLQAIRLGLERDRVSTCCKFALDAELADYLRTQSLDRLMFFVANVGQTSLFPPRDDLLALLMAPAPLAAPLAAVRFPKALAAHVRR
jgi:hypothetical protein